MRIGPDTSYGLEPLRIPFLNFGGYYYGHNWLECISHTHCVGAGLGDYQNFGVTVVRQWDDNIIQNSNYRSLFSHDQEVALPGYYAVDLLTHNTFAETTVTGPHSGMHRYTCRPELPARNAPCVLIIDLCHGFSKVLGNLTAQCLRAQILNVTARGDGGVAFDLWMVNAGMFSTNAHNGGIDIFLSGEIRASHVFPTGARTTAVMGATSWADGAVQTGIYAGKTTSGSLGLAFHVAPSNASVEFLLRTALSFVSSANARENLATEQSSATSFEGAVQSAVDVWEDALSSVTHRGGLRRSWRERVFDATLYRSFLPPTTYSDVNGEYLGEDWGVHKVGPGRRHLSDLSIWDIFRTQTTMLLWTQPAIARDIANSMMDMYNLTGGLPKWPFANLETNCMAGHHSAAIFADYVTKGLGGIDEQSIVNAVIEVVNRQNQNHLPIFGYVPFEFNELAASETLDLAIDSAAAAMLVAYADRTVANFSIFAESYRNLWNNSTNLICPRFANGSFWCPNPVVPFPFEEYYTEGDAAQYRWYVPQDTRGLIALFPSVETFVDDLYSFFLDSYIWPLNNTLPNPWFWAGNEPDIQTPMLFNWAGNEYAYLTSEVFPSLLDTYYTPYPSGLPGNDDYGAMSAWCFWGYIGLFPMVPAYEYALFAPLFDEITVAVDATGFEFTPWRKTVAKSNASSRTTIVNIAARNRPATGTAYVTSVTLNGKRLATPIVTQAQLMATRNGAPTTLVFDLTDEPTVFGELPPSRGGPPVYIPKYRAGSIEQITLWKSGILGKDAVSITFDAYRQKLSGMARTHGK
jgi:predicted alpha-1,2-mannosidase